MLLDKSARLQHGVRACPAVHARVAAEQGGGARGHAICPGFWVLAWVCTWDQEQPAMLLDREPFARKHAGPHWQHLLAQANSTHQSTRAAPTCAVDQDI